ncbi:hypothetical protein LOTGIDRAFT_177643 [Lottia gigantea]|uniref:WD repeat-containing protein 91 n=1 Tax=Lottia gigantea TaxID=225164 RepID=V3ZK09_LOTGI|nr:hypothetical protein LOTGIDRAFT_177643 [Lottia gigantea]ESO82720.1 hypothetical protein LOTGIDRAFT_177643 [Lottia gigantea]
MATATSRVDELIKDYLLFRGLTSTLKALENELKTEKEKGLRADKIVEQIQYYIVNNDLLGLRDYWTFLNSRLFLRLEQQYMSSVRRLEVNILKLYIVIASQSNKPEKIVEFFDKMILLADLQNQPEFREWFAFPFIKNPEENPTFMMYFNKQWQDTLMLSLHNFLIPTLLNFEYDHKRMKFLQEENSVLKERVTYSSQQEMAKFEKLILKTMSFQQEFQTCQLLEELFLIYQRYLCCFLINLFHAIVKDLWHELYQKSIESNDRRLKLYQSSFISDKLSKEPTRSSSPDKQKTNRRPLFNLSTGLLSKKKPEVNTATTSKPEISKPVKIKPKPAIVPVTTTKKTISTTPRQTSVVMEEYSEHHSSVSYSRFSPSGQYISSLDVDGIIKLWTWSPQPATIYTVMARSAFLSLEWVNKSDRYLLLGNRNFNIRLLDVKENKTIKEVAVDTVYPRILNITSNPSGLSFICSAAGQRMRNLSSEVNPGSKPGKLMLWDVKTMKMEKQLVLDPNPVAINCSSYNHNGQLLITGGADGIVRLFDIHQCKCISQWNAHDGEVNGVEFSSDETSCYTFGADGKFLQWSIHKPGSKLEELPIHAGASLPFLATSPTGNKELPRGSLFSFDSDGRYILTCDRNKTVIYQADKEFGLKKTMELKGHKSSVTTVDWSPSLDTRVALSGAMDGKIKVSTLLSQ